MSRARSLANLANSGVFSADASTSRVGINSSAPESTLDVVGDGRVSGTLSIGGTINYEDVTSIDSVGVVTAREGVHIVSAGASIYSPANNELALYTNSSERVRITSAGKVGIGTVASAGIQLQVYHATINEVARLMSGDSTVALSFQDGDTTSNRPTIGGKTDDFFIQVGGAEKLRITSAGKVGIGLTDPEEIVHILGSTETIESRDGVTLQHSTATAAADNGLPLVWSGYVGSGSGLQNYGLASICGRKENSNADDGAAYLQFGVGRASGAIIERLRITSVGRVGIGTDNPSVSVDLSENTDAVALPTGTTAQRPSGTDAYIRKNSTNNALEFYNGTEWVEIITDYFPTGSTTLG